MVKCKICSKEYKNLFGLSKHISKIHNLTSEEYYLKYLGQIGFCEHCREKSKFKNLVNGYQKFCSLKCCNNYIKKRKLVSENKKEWWKKSDDIVIAITKDKIKKTVTKLWKDDNSIFNTNEYRQNLSKGLSSRWKKWRESDFLNLSTSYGFESVDDYKNSHSNTKFKCLKCGNEFETIWNYLQSGKSCPYCYPNGVSKAEEELYQYIRTLTNEDIIRNTKKIISPKELDLYIPAKNLAFEYNGLFSHSANCPWGHKERNYHLQKTIECSKKDIRLIHIFEDEWLFKKEIVQSRISNIMGEVNKPVIYARKCKIAEISTFDKNQFLEKFHLQGKDSSKIKLGAFYNDELISVMTFSNGNISKGSKEEDGVWELNRFCSNKNYHVVGIASKLLTYFKKKYHWRKIFSYADRRWSVGNLYIKLSFNLDYITYPNYWYIKGYKRIHRFSLRKTKEEPKHLTEFELRLKQGYDWIWDCGNYKFSMINMEETK